MTDPAHAPPPIFNFNAYGPAEIQDAIETVVLFSHHLDMNGGRIGLSILNTAVAKISPDIVTLFVKGILCNVLVCLAVWLAYAGRSVTDKIVGLILPISAFVAAGFEHCIANMYFLPLAWLQTATGKIPAGFDASLITIPGIIHNLVPVTLGNIVGGAGLVGFVTGRSIARAWGRIEHGSLNATSDAAGSGLVHHDVVRGRWQLVTILRSDLLPVHTLR
jgi:hypothetical protein